jgi:hypothetical protein
MEKRVMTSYAVTKIRISVIIRTTRRLRVDRIVVCVTFQRECGIWPAPLELSATMLRLRRTLVYCSRTKNEMERN